MYLIRKADSGLRESPDSSFHASSHMKTGSWLKATSFSSLSHTKQDLITYYMLCSQIKYNLLANRKKNCTVCQSQTHEGMCALVSMHIQDVCFLYECQLGTFCCRICQRLSKKKKVRCQRRRDHKYPQRNVMIGEERGRGGACR